MSRTVDMAISFELSILALRVEILRLARWQAAPSFVRDNK